MAVETRPARAADVPEIARLVAAMAAYHESLDERARFDWEEIRQAPIWLQTVFARDHHALWVADGGDGHLAGYLWVRLVRDHSGYLPRMRGSAIYRIGYARWLRNVAVALGNARPSPAVPRECTPGTSRAATPVAGLKTALLRPLCPATR